MADSLVGDLKEAIAAGDARRGLWRVHGYDRWRRVNLVDMLIARA